MKEFYNQIRQWYDPTRHAGLLPEQVEKIYCIYAYVNKAKTDRGRKKSDLRGNTFNLHSYTAKITSLPQIREFSRSNAEVALDIKRGESRGYRKRYSPGKWFRHAKISGRTNQERAILLLDTGAEVSILDNTYARKVGCHFDTSVE
ncbi:Eukaryotic/viral aspartic protease [Phytophthora megakarya]|uniref:Eukaryotic/viral aspartic protease n=1 Tax=Phytophthora megakarya TaxID=4795 RepID=A0A225UNN2_9STRA|nr:Eukaryotic/viral aspartic protease [Phytophthora megakarya]